MPCYSDYSVPKEIELINEVSNAKEETFNHKIGINNLQKQLKLSEGNIDILNKHIELYKKELDFVTSLLCESLNKIEKLGYFDDLSEENKKWFEKHKKFDKEREI